MDYRWLWRVYKATPALLLLLFVIGCATKRPSDVATIPSPPATDDLMRLIRRGCYHCLEQAFADYRRTQFGGRPFTDHAPVHPRDQRRFARHADGRVEQAPA